MSNFVLGEGSIKKLEGVDPRLIALANLAIKKTKQDFAVTYGLRTKEEQTELLKKGFTKTMNSRHLTGHAIDVAAWHDGKIDYDYERMYTIAQGFREAAEELDLTIRWGGCWSNLRSLKTVDQMKACVEQYIKSKQYRDEKGKLRSSALVDMPHFEIPRS